MTCFPVYISDSQTAHAEAPRELARKSTHLPRPPPRQNPPPTPSRLLLETRSCCTRWLSPVLCCAVDCLIIMLLATRRTGCNGRPSLAWL